MARQPRRYLNERQPVLPFNDAYQAMNRRDLERETTPPVQMELLPLAQLDLFEQAPLSDSLDPRPPLRCGTV